MILSRIGKLILRPTPLDERNALFGGFYPQTLLLNPKP